MIACSRSGSRRTATTSALPKSGPHRVVATDSRNDAAVSAPTPRPRTRARARRAAVGQATDGITAGVTDSSLFDRQPPGTSTFTLASMTATPGVTDGESYVYATQPRPARRSYARDYL